MSCSEGFCYGVEKQQPASQPAKLFLELTCDNTSRYKGALKSAESDGKANRAREKYEAKIDISRLRRLKECCL